MSKIVQKVKNLDQNDWLMIKTKFEDGESLRQIAAQYDIAPNTIRNYAITHAWKKGDFAQPKAAVREDLMVLAQSVQAEQREIVAKQMHDAVDEAFDIMPSIQQLQRRAIGLHNYILKDTIAKVKTGEVSSYLASKTLASQQMGTKDILQVNGLSKERIITVQNNMQLNNNKEISAELEESDPEAAYLALIND